jgi:hypothetical protein
MTATRSGLVMTDNIHAPIQVGARTLTPLSRTIGLRLPWGGWAWHFPVAVDVEEEGRVTRLPIPDPTRTVVLTVILFTLKVLVRTLWTRPHRA